MSASQQAAYVPCNPRVSICTDVVTVAYVRPANLTALLGGVLLPWQAEEVGAAYALFCAVPASLTNEQLEACVPFLRYRQLYPLFWTSGVYYVRPRIADVAREARPVQRVAVVRAAPARVATVRVAPKPVVTPKPVAKPVVRVVVKAKN
jgi:hypothetical protein